jgi:hypothetical protein
LIEPLDLFHVDVDAHHLVADFGKHRRLHETDIANSKDRQIHLVLFLFKASDRLRSGRFRFAFT